MTERLEELGEGGSRGVVEWLYHATGILALNSFAKEC